jgi:hypothetical protein
MKDTTGKRLNRFLPNRSQTARKGTHRAVYCSVQNGKPLRLSAECPLTGREESSRFFGVDRGLSNFQPADIVTQILNFGIPAQIDERAVGYDRDKNLTLVVVPYLFAMLRKGNDGQPAHQEEPA